MQRSFDIIGLGIAVIFLNVLALTAPIHMVDGCVGHRRDSARVATHPYDENFFHEVVRSREIAPFFSNVVVTLFESLETSP